jgi:hypothetical protein
MYGRRGMTVNESGLQNIDFMLAPAATIHNTEFVLSFGSPRAEAGHRLDAPGADRRCSTHTVASVRTTVNEASARRLAPVPPWKVSL